MILSIGSPVHIVYAQSQNPMSEGWNNNAAFQLHQATERFLNAMVLTFTRYKPKTRDIERLDRQGATCTPISSRSSLGQVSNKSVASTS